MGDAPRYSNPHDSHKGSEGESHPDTPPWVKALGIGFLILLLFSAIMMAGGHHGPSRHMPGAGLHSEASSASIVHLTSSVGWIGAVIAYLALGLSAVNSGDSQTVRAAWIAMESTGWMVIIPMAIAALLTGLIMSLGTQWGLFRHYWVLLSFVLTILCTVVLLLHMPSVTALANVARTADGAGLHRLGGDLFHPAVGLLVLLVITVLNVYKPRGVTRYGWRKQHEQRDMTRQ